MDSEPNLNRLNSGDSSHGTNRDVKPVNPLIGYFSELKTNNILPKTLGMMNHKNNEKDWNLKSFYIGDKYAEAFSKLFESNSKLQSLILSRNGLTDNGMIKVIR